MIIKKAAASILSFYVAVASTMLCIAELLLSASK
jgi:hypothetical protein